jgi:uncharacterized protein (DUF1778 family)
MRHTLRMRQATAKKTASKSVRESSKDTGVLVLFDAAGKALVKRAAAVRGLPVRDYVRTRIITLAHQDVEEADTGVLRLPREAQIAFWQALQNPPPPTKAQRRLGALVRSVM